MLPKLLFVLCVFYVVSPSLAQDFAIVSGKLHKKQKVRFSYDGNFVSFEEKTYKIKPLSNGSFQVKLPLKAIRKVRFEYGKKTWQLVLKPKDSLSLVVDAKNELHLFGKSAAESRYFLEMQKRFKAQQHRYMHNTDGFERMQAFQAKIIADYEKELAFLENYLKENETSQDFQHFVKANLQYSAISNQYVVKYWLLWSKNITIGKLPEAYYDFFNKADFDNETALESPSYHSAVEHYMSFLYQSKPEETSKHWLVERIDIAKQQLQGATFDHWLAAFLYEELNPSTALALQKSYEEYLQTGLNETYKAILQKKMKKLQKHLAGLTFLLPPQLYVVADKEDISLEQLLEKYRGKVIYVDVWASWCSPCIEEMPAARALQEKYRGKDVVFLYLGYRDDEKPWRAAINDLKISGEHYLLTSKLNKKLEETFLKEGVPHYLLVGKDGQVSMTNAPMPSQKKDIHKALGKLLKKK